MYIYTCIDICTICIISINCICFGNMSCSIVLNPLNLLVVF